MNCDGCASDGCCTRDGCKRCCLCGGKIEPPKDVKPTTSTRAALNTLRRFFGPLQEQKAIGRTPWDDAREAFDTLNKVCTHAPR